MPTSPWTPPDPDSWKPENTAAASSPESARRLEELAARLDASSARYAAEKAARKAAGFDYNAFIAGGRAWSWSRDGLEFSLARHPDFKHWRGYVRFPNRPLKEPGYRGIVTYVPVHGGVTWAEDSPDGSFVYGFDCNHAWDRKDGTLQGHAERMRKFIRTRNLADPEGTPIRRTRKWLTAQCESMAAGIRVAVRFEDAYIAAAGDSQQRALILDQYRAYLRTEGLGTVAQEPVGVMLNLLSGQL